MLSNLFIAAILLAPGRTAEAPFQDLTFDQALAAAKKDGKVVMVDFFTTWCVPCKKLDKTTWTDPEVQKWLAEKTVALKIDAEKEVPLAKRFNITGYPTILFVKADGTEMDHLVGYKNPADFLEAAKGALSGKDTLTQEKEKLAGNEKDPMKRSRYANALAQAGKNQEALAEYLWCFDHGNDDPATAKGYSGVRRSFLLGDIARLGKQYPPATQALQERREMAEAAVLSGKGTKDDAKDMAALNRCLEASGKTLATYDRLKKDGHLDPVLKETLVDYVAPQLVDARRYAELVEDAGDVVLRVIEQLELCKARVKGAPSKDEETLKVMREMEPSLQAMDVKTSSVWYEAALGAGLTAQASSIADRLIEYSPTSSTYTILIDRALHANAESAARALAERGRSSLPEGEKAALEAAAKKIPASK